MVEAGLYRHFKGDTYEVLGVAKVIGSDEQHVIWKCPISKNQNGGYDVALWATPVATFTDSVIWKGEKIKRYTRIDV